MILTNIVFKASVRRRLGAKAQLEVEASRRLGKWSKATLCRRQRQLQGKGEASATVSRRRRQLHRKGKAPAAASRWWRLQGKAPAAVVAAGEGEAQWQQRKERRWQRKGAAAPSGSRERSTGSRMKRESRQQKGKEQRRQNEAGAAVAEGQGAHRFGGNSCFMGHGPIV
jgi:hypothetical protein